MTTADARLSIRPPVWARAWIVVFLRFWLWILLVQFRPDIGIPAVLIAVLGAAFSIRMFVSGAFGSAHGRFGGGQALWLVLADGSRYRIDVTEVPFRGPSGGRLDRDAEAIRAWLSERPRPFL